MPLLMRQALDLESFPILQSIAATRDTMVTMDGSLIISSGTLAISDGSNVILSGCSVILTPSRMNVDA